MRGRHWAAASLFTSLRAVNPDGGQFRFHDVEEFKARISRVEKQAFDSTSAIEERALKATPGTEHRHLFQVPHRNPAPPNAKNRKPAKGPGRERKRVCVDNDAAQLEDEQLYAKQTLREREPAERRRRAQDKISEPERTTDSDPANTYGFVH